MSGHKHHVRPLMTARQQEGELLRGSGLYEKFRQLRLEGGAELVGAVEDCRVRVHLILLRSAPLRHLTPADSPENATQLFEAPLFLPAKGAAGPRLVIILHGLNEVRYGKLFAWAYNYTALTGTATLIFPLVFHLNRRPSVLRGLARGLYRSRRQLPGNRFASPFNAARSRHLDENPCRLVSELRQGLDDLLAVRSMLRSGELAPLLTDTTVHFLGYSLGGYLALTALCSTDAWGDSRALLFASGGPLEAGDDKERANSRSTVIVDGRAAERIRATVCRWANGSRVPATEGRAELMTVGSRRAGVVPATMLDDEPVRLILALLSGRLSAADARRVATLTPRVRLVALCGDRIMPPAAIRLTLESLLGPIDELWGGSHEFPFALGIEPPEDLEEARRERRDAYEQLRRVMRYPADIAVTYEAQFTSFLDLTATHLERG